MSANKTLATQTHTQSGRFVVIEEGMGVQNRKIKFKVNQLKNWIGVGVCLKNKIVAASYQFKCTCITTQIKYWGMEVTCCPTTATPGRTPAPRTTSTPVSSLSARTTSWKSPSNLKN